MSILNTEIKINQLVLPNRLVMPPMATAKSGEDGTVTPALCDYYSEKSSGGYIGLIIVEHCFVSPEGKASNGQLSIAKDADILGLEKLVNSIHHNHTKVMAQINHAGGAASRLVTGCEVVSASAVPMPRNRGENAELPREMNLYDIQQVIVDFQKAALRAKAAGFDGVEIHAAHGYLLNQFFSPLTNKRTDAYNADTLIGRMKLLFEIIYAIREAVGPSYPIALRLGACDYMQGGSTIQDSVAAAMMLEQAGIDLLDISGGFCGYINPDNKEQGYFSEITEEMKRNVQIPVLVTGGILDVYAAEKLLGEKKADLIGVGRAIMKDSLWAKKAMETIG